MLTSCGGADERKAAYLEKAKQSIEAGDLDKARIELKNVLQIDPKFSEAYFELGKIFEEKQNYRKAFGNYTKAAELSPDNFQSQAKLGHFFLLFLKDEDKAKEKMDLILSKDPANVEGLLLKAKIMIYAQKIDEALSITQDIFDKNPGHIDNAILLATLYIRKEDNANAIKVLETNLGHNVSSEKVNQLLARIYMLAKDYDKAEVVFQNALNEKPDVFRNYKNLAAFYNSVDKQDKAEAVLRSAITNKPDDVERQIYLIKNIKEIKGNAAAIEETRELIQKKPEIGGLRTALGSLYVLEGDTDAAKQVYQKAITDFSEEETEIESRISLTALFIQEKEFEKAKQQIDDAIAISPNDPNVNLLKAKIALQEKDYETAIIALRIVIKESPDKIEAYLLLAAAHVALGEEEAARSVITSAHENNRDNADSLLVLAKYHARMNDAVQAEKVIDDYLLLNDNNYEALSIKVTLLNKQKKNAESKPLAMKMVELYPNKPNGYVYSIPYLAEEQDREKAVALLKEGYEKVEDNTLILKLLTSIQISMNQVDEAKQRVNAAIAESPDKIDNHVLLAKIYIATKDSVNAEKKLNEIIQNYPNNEEAYLLLADSYKKAGNESGYKAALEDGNKNVEKSYKIPLSLARVYELEKNYDAAIDVYEQLLLNYPDNVIVINNLASMLSDHRTDEKSLGRAKELADRISKSEQPVILDTVGWVYYKTGNYAAAVDALKTVVEKEPEINIFNYHLGMAYKAAGDKDNARLYLEKSLANGKEFNGKADAEKMLGTL